MRIRNVAILLIGVGLMAASLILTSMALTECPQIGWDIRPHGPLSTTGMLLEAAFFAGFLTFLVALVLLTVEGVKRLRKKRA